MIPHVVESNRDALLARMSSVSFVAILEPDERAQLLIDASELLDRHGVGAPGQTLVTPYQTRVVWARRS